MKTGRMCFCYTIVMLFKNHVLSCYRSGDLCCFGRRCQLTYSVDQVCWGLYSCVSAVAVATTEECKVKPSPDINIGIGPFCKTLNVRIRTVNGAIWVYFNLDRLNYRAHQNLIFPSRGLPASTVQAFLEQEWKSDCVTVKLFGCTGDWVC